MIPKAFLYPQSIFFPDRSLKFFELVETIFVVELPNTKRIIEKHQKRLNLDKLEFLSLRETLKSMAVNLQKLAHELQAFGEYLRYPESFRYFFLHQELFEETYVDLFRERKTLCPLERALLILMLAEMVDSDLWDVTSALKDFEKVWKNLFEERIIYKNPYEETPSPFFRAFEEADTEKLWNLNLRVQALRVILPELNWKGAKDLNTLLITERELLEDLTEGMSLEREELLTEGVCLKVFRESLNPKIGLPSEFNYPSFSQILITY
ncbi:MAG: hypothetical protein N2Z40_03820 [Caldimicrobium sp.]|nr:hypothetical protein [Caldimicrobium sp.]MCX7613338.1 hypothetical protein [Caldimicrobium sp.]MDW8183381.1 hypothetical protein [Caldimicrobium sp.]